MAVAAQKSVASLMQKTLDRQAALARMRLKFSKNQIEQILLNYARKGSAGPYGELVKVLRDYPLNDENYRIVFDDCLSCVVVLGRDFKQIVEAVCDVEWASRSEELVGLFSRFVLSLVSAHSYHCQQVMTCLVKLFKADDEGWEDSPPPEKVHRWSNIHTVIAQIVAIIPMCIDLLMHIVIEQFPYYKAGCNANRVYIHNLIWMSKYIPSLREQIMAAIINRMIVMDVNIVEREKNKSQNETIFEMDVEERDEVSDALDYSMLEMLHWLEDERSPVLNLLCNVFERIVLPTYGIRHVQFLILYAVSINQQCADRILNNLWVVAAGLQGLGPGAFATRRTAASHLAGLLARCVRVPNTRLVFYLKTMADWCHKYITATQESTTATDSMKAHGAFHAICHAIFYLVAFKNHHLFMSKENLNFVESLNLPRLVACALNPLRSCPPPVARAFASVTRAHQLVYCAPVMERNARNSLQASTAVHYDEWFPYDPYTLPRSGKIIWPLCIEYKDFLNVGEDETQYTSMKKKLEGDDDDFLMSASPCQRLASSLSNGVSPGFRTSENILIN
ncbi:RNA polymerase I-specific transcription initiation factor RRN3 [Manduca sexta]|uniref:RNA polymerase I-specific transcription initiation factor RRN3 n=1 Tax=Manduca sexta TaxID=7130 RepID=UPI00188E60A0|nr:RNA polymerase I-specific transcription initiation factor RRN3 [Manduca sexta]